MSLRVMMRMSSEKKVNWFLAPGSASPVDDHHHHGIMIMNSVDRCDHIIMHGFICCQEKSDLWISLWSFPLIVNWGDFEKVNPWYCEGRHPLERKSAFLCSAYSNTRNISKHWIHRMITGTVFKIQNENPGKTGFRPLRLNRLTSPLKLQKTPSKARASG